MWLSQLIPFCFQSFLTVWFEFLGQVVSFLPQRGIKYKISLMKEIFKFWKITYKTFSSDTISVKRFMNNMLKGSIKLIVLMWVFKKIPDNEVKILGWQSFYSPGRKRFQIWKYHVIYHIGRILHTYSELVLKIFERGHKTILHVTICTHCPRSVKWLYNFCLNLITFPIVKIIVNSKVETINVIKCEVEIDLSSNSMVSVRM